MTISITTQMPGYEPRTVEVQANVAHAYMASIGINRSTARSLLKQLGQHAHVERVIPSGTKVSLAVVR